MSDVKIELLPCTNIAFIRVFGFQFRLGGRMHEKLCHSTDKNSRCPPLKNICIFTRKHVSI